MHEHALVDRGHEHPASTARRKVMLAPIQRNGSDQRIMTSNSRSGAARSTARRRSKEGTRYSRGGDQRRWTAPHTRAASPAYFSAMRPRRARYSSSQREAASGTGCSCTRSSRASFLRWEATDWPAIACRFFGTAA